MVVRKGDFDYWVVELAKAFGFDIKQAHSITFEDSKAYITPHKQGPAELTITKGEESIPQRGVTVGPRFRKSHCVITVTKEDGKVLFTNKRKTKSK